MIDHAARAEVRAAVEDFLFDRTGSFAFDERIFAIETEDRTVRSAVTMLWGCYSDVDDHLVRFDRRSWKCLQRLLLLLDSDAELEETSRRIWHPSQLVALATLVVMGFIYCKHGDLGLLLYFSGGLVSLLLYSWRSRRSREFDQPDPWHCYPFTTIGEIRQALERARTFQRPAFRSEIEARCGTPSPITDGFARGKMIFAWLKYSPVPLLFQTLPLNTTKTKVVWN